ncbi:MAG: hypothetical protein OXI33_04550 [Chloroflexota bacterium]|nr:hypothetical protein [Chloroflexota bacterium]
MIVVSRALSQSATSRATLPDQLDPQVQAENVRSSGERVEANVVVTVVD